MATNNQCRLRKTIGKTIAKWENHRKTHGEMEVYPLVNVYKKLWNITIVMGKSTISLGHFLCRKVLNYRRVICNSQD